MPYQNRTRYIVCYQLIILVAISIFLSGYAIADTGVIVPENLDEMVNARIRIINQMIQDPREASMKNWRILGNPHDESELNFYLNSVSAGTADALCKTSPEWERFLAHSRSFSSGEPSVLLQHLRLSLLALNMRPGRYPPLLILLSHTQKGLYLVLVECILMVYDSGGVRIGIPSSLYFSIGDDPDNDLFLGKVTVEKNVIYGYWHTGYR